MLGSWVLIALTLAVPFLIVADDCLDTSALDLGLCKTTYGKDYCASVVSSKAENLPSSAMGIRRKDHKQLNEHLRKLANNQVGLLAGEVIPSAIRFVLSDTELFGYGLGECADVSAAFACAEAFPKCHQGRPYYRLCGCESFESACATVLSELRKDPDQFAAKVDGRYTWWYDNRQTLGEATAAALFDMCARSKVMNKWEVDMHCTPDPGVMFSPRFVSQSYYDEQRTAAYGFFAQTCYKGCDNIMMGKQLDSCGVCGGDNSTCTTGIKARIADEVGDILDSLHISNLMEVRGLKHWAVVVLYLGFVMWLLVFLFAGVFVLLEPAGKRRQQQQIMLVTLVACITYFVMASGHGIMLARNVSEWEWDNELLSTQPAKGSVSALLPLYDEQYQSAQLTVVFFIRYLEWLFTMPTIILQLCQVGRAPPPLQADAVRYALLAMACWLTGSATLRLIKWLLWAAGTAFAAALCWTLCGPVLAAARKASADAYLTLAVPFVGAWVVMCLMWLLTCGVHVVPSEADVVVMLVVDIVCKMALCVRILRYLHNPSAPNLPSSLPAQIVESVPSVGSRMPRIETDSA